MQKAEYYSVEEMLEMIEEPNRSRVIRLFQDHEERFRVAPGASNNHHAWKGGYYDHVGEVMNLAIQIFHTLDGLRPLPFSLSDVLTVMFLHDLEKAWKYSWIFDGILKDTSMTKAERKTFREEQIQEYGIELSEEQENGLRYVEGVPDSEYVSGERTMGPLAALCHTCDMISARLWFEFPEEENDPWTGAGRAVNT